MWDIVLPALLTLCTIRMGYLGMQMTLHPPQSVGEKAEYKWDFIIIGGLSVCLIIGQGVRNYLTQEETKQAQGQLNADLQAERDELKALRADIAKESARRDQVQQEMAAKTELEKKKQAETSAKIEAARRNREVNFMNPYKELVHRSRGNIRMMNEPISDTKYFKDAAEEWLGDMLTLLKKHCPERVWIKFQYPDRVAGLATHFPDNWNKRFREEYPFILNSEALPFAAFYRLSIEELGKEDLSDCK